MGNLVVVLLLGFLAHTLSAGALVDSGVEPNVESIESVASTYLSLAAAGDNADEMLFYRGDGVFRFYDISSNGSLGSPILAGDGYTKGWSSITAVDLDGDSQDEMFFYRDDGVFRFYDVSSNGSLGSPILAGDGYTKGWSSITAVDLDGDSQDEMFFYRDDGVFRFYDIRSDGSIGSPILAGDGYTRNWTSITAIDLDGDGQDELFFYRDDGVFRYYNVSPNGSLGSPILAGDGYTKGWSSITAVDLDGDSRDEIFFYRTDGSFRYYDIGASGRVGSPILAGSNYTQGWDSITAVDLDDPAANRYWSSSSPFNTPIPSQPRLDPRSGGIAGFLSQQVVFDLYEYGIAIHHANPSTPRVNVTCTANWGVCPTTAINPIPVPEDTKPPPGSDGNTVIVDWSSNRAISMHQPRKNSNGSWSATWVTVTDLRSSGVPPAGGNGAGVSHLAGVVELDEIQRGHIDHALVFSTSQLCASTFRYPARKTDGQSSSQTCIQAGARVQLDPSIDVNALGLTKGERAVARALQVYGAYAVDRGGAPMAIYFQVAADASGQNPGSVYRQAGLDRDYFRSLRIPWASLRVLANWDGR